MQYKPSKWVPGYKHSPASSYVQITRMGLFLNVSTEKFEPLDSTWDNLHSGGMFISDDNKIYFRDETNKDIYINSPADNQLALYASSGVGINTSSPNKTLDVSDGGFAVSIGADLNANTQTDSTTKYGRVGAPHYDTAEEHTITYLAYNTSSVNGVYIGGGTNQGNAATEIALYTAANNTTLTGTNRLTAESGGDITIETGTVVIGTAGKGIDFQNQASPAAGMTSELLDRYEEGTFTAVLTGASGAPTTACEAVGQYTRIGRLVNVSFGFRAVNTTGGSGSAIITGLPFTVNSDVAFTGQGSLVTYNLSIPGDTLTLYPTSAGTTVYLYSSADNGAWAATTLTATATIYLHGSLTYVV